MSPIFMIYQELFFAKCEFISERVFDVCPHARLFAPNLPTFLSSTCKWVSRNESVSLQNLLLKEAWNAPVKPPQVQKRNDTRLPVTYGSKIVKAQWLISGDWCLPLVNGPKLAGGGGIEVLKSAILHGQTRRYFRDEDILFKMKHQRHLY